ncbi:MAG: hypothetical protein ACRET7_00285 [Burkholderiales bacterium]
MIADIELQRQAMEKEAGRAASCSSALRRLHELLEREQETRQRRDPDAGRPENIVAVTAEIDRVKALAVATIRRPAGKGAYPRQPKESWRDAQTNPGRNRGRRTMGRAGGRG